jgi:hypothetical protein
MEGINIVIIPTKVEFNSADYCRLLKQIKSLEDKLEDKEKRLEALTTETTRFFQKLSMIADIKELDMVGLEDYEIFLEIGHTPEIVKFITRRNG